MKQNECVVIKKSQVSETLLSTPTPGKKLLNPLKQFSADKKVPVNVLEDNAVVNDAEVHKHEADLWLCLEGEVTFVYGGEMVDQWVKQNPDGTTDDREWKAKEIRGGTEVVLREGDWLWIPAGQPHQHKTAGIARLIIIKIPNI